MRALSDEALRARTREFQNQIAEGRTVDDLLEPAFAVVREAARRVLDMRHYDVQLIGGMVLHQGKIAEMKTGEGKTLVATLPVYLNALEGKGVHVVTVNDYLARRDAEWMGQVYRFLGLSVGVIQHGLDRRRAAAGLRRRHHLRHQQRVRLRLPARQHEVRPRGDGPARPPLRHRRRGRLDPDRRGPDAAHHLGSGRGVGRQVLQDRPHHPQLAQARRSRRRTAPSAPPATSWSTRRPRPRPSPRRASPGSRSCSASRTSTTPRTWSCCTTSTRPCARTTSINATSTTWSRTARSSSSTSSPAA